MCTQHLCSIWSSRHFLSSQPPCESPAPRFPQSTTGLGLRVRWKPPCVGTPQLIPCRWESGAMGGGICGAMPACFPCRRWCSLAEYSLALVLVGLTAALVVGFVGDTTSDAFDEVGNAFRRKRPPLPSTMVGLPTSSMICSPGSMALIRWGNNSSAKSRTPEAGTSEAMSRRQSPTRLAHQAGRRPARKTALVR